VAKVKSGTINERRIMKNSWREFHEVDYAAFCEREFLPWRSFSTLRGWLNDLKVKKGKFDRYSCGVCFEGKMAEERIRVGKEQVGDKEKVEKWEDHVTLFRHQFEEAKKDKEINQDDTIFLFMITAPSTTLLPKRFLLLLLLLLLLFFFILRKNREERKRKGRRKRKKGREEGKERKHNLKNR